MRKTRPRLTAKARRWQRRWREALLAGLQRSLAVHLEETADRLHLHPDSLSRQRQLASRLLERIGEALPELIDDVEDAVRATNEGKLDEDAWLCVLSMPVDEKDPRGIRLRMENAPHPTATLAHHLWHRVVRPSLPKDVGARPFSSAGQRATVAWEAARGWLSAHPDVSVLTRPFETPDAQCLCELARRAYWRPVPILVPETELAGDIPDRLRPDDRVRSSPEVRRSLRTCLARLEKEGRLSRGQALRALATVLAWWFPSIWPARATRNRKGQRVRDYVREVNLLRRELKLA